MFKTLSLFRFGAAEPFRADDLGAQFLALPFAPCGPSQAKSIGFVPPRGHAHGAMVEAVSLEWIAKVMIEKRMLPGSVVRDRVDELAKKIEQETGRKPGAKRRRELKDEAMIDLLPQAFTKQAAAFLWFGLGGILAIGSTTSAVVDDVLTLISKAAPGLVIQPLNTKEAPAALMRSLLEGGDDADESSFHPGFEAVLVDPSLGSASVRYSKHSLAGADVRQHLEAGKSVKSLALEFGDSLTFALDDCLRLKKIEIEEVSLVAKGDEDPFDADVILTTSTLAPAIEALIFELDGLVEQPVPVQDPAPAEPAKAPEVPPVRDEPIRAAEGLDPLYPQAVALVAQHRRASISLIQRYLQIGYNRAARLLEAMEKAGLVSAMNSDGHLNIITTESSA